MNVFSIDFWESERSPDLSQSSAQLNEQRFICLISKVSLPAHLVIDHRYNGVVGVNDVGAGRLSCKFRGYHSDTSVVG